MAAGSSTKHLLNHSDSESDMATTRKTRRCQRPKQPSHSKPVGKSTICSCNHPYLQDRELSAIERWNEGIPVKPTSSSDAERDAAIRAYMQAKMALFQGLDGQIRRKDSTMSDSTASVSTTKSS